MRSCPLVKFATPIMQCSILAARDVLRLNHPDTERAETQASGMNLRQGLDGMVLVQR